MWAPEASTHVFRGKGRSRLCCRCHNYISIGERYDRRFYRAGRGRRSRLFVEVEHANERDCPYAEFDAMMEELLQERSIGVAITMVVSSRLVAKVALNGEMIYLSESYIEMKAENTAGSQDDADHDGLPDDGDDEIPF